ncbi:ABC transporter permease subunit [Alphaproteobacteria bacterium]|nr:ABC transporter permease subunit [Alphaproteobacteria bacterium]
MAALDRKVEQMSSFLMMSAPVIPFLLLWLCKPFLPSWAIVPPKSCLGGCGTIEGMIPFVDWVNIGIQFLRNYEIFDLFTFRDVTRSIARGIDVPLGLTEAILYKGFANFGPMPWIMIVGLMIVLGLYLRGWRLALLGGGTFFYLALFSLRGIWELSMKTLSAIAVSVPLAAIIGLLLGILAAKREGVAIVMRPMLNVLQSLPHFSYLIIVAIFFGVGAKAGVIAPIIFAFPPMTRLTMMGLREISSEVREAGIMSGCTRWQMLYKVEIPAARAALMLGVNQVIMQCLAMVVIASFIGQPGLGHDLLTRLRNLRLGQAFEIGVAVVLIAVTLDRYSQALVEKEPERIKDGPIWVRHPYLCAMLAVIFISMGLASLSDAAVQLPTAYTISMSIYLDAVIAFITTSLFTPLGILRDFLLIYVFVPTKVVFQSMPWVAVMALVGCAGWKLGRWKLALTVMAFVFFIAASGYWVRAVITLYMVFVALCICTAIVIPLGIWAAKKDGRTKFVLGLCDTFQTFPSFIYLLPAVMLFQISDVSAIFAIVIYATIPITRYTIFGLRNIPRQIVEAALTSGCTERQMLWKVHMPIAFPEMLLGLNQTLMFALFMVMIAGFIGTVDLSQEIFRALSFNDGGKGLVIGLCVSLIGLTADRLLVEWSLLQKQRLGFAS